MALSCTSNISTTTTGGKLLTFGGTVVIMVPPIEEKQMTYNHAQYLKNKLADRSLSTQEYLQVEREYRDLIASQNRINQEAEKHQPALYTIWPRR